MSNDFGGVDPRDVELAQEELNNPAPKINFFNTTPAQVAAEKHDIGAGHLIGEAGAAGIPGAPVEPNIAPGTPGHMEGNEDALDAIKNDARIKDYLIGGNDGVQAPSAFYAPAHEEYSQVYGKRGKERFNQAFGDGPDDPATKEMQAIEAVSKLQEQRSAALGKSYDEESNRSTQAMAARRMSTEADQRELQLRQQNLEAATQQYTNDLADQNKFWTNPGNIIAAISFSLMPIFSNDPTIGVKLVNQAIQQDLDNRRQNAQGTLGALRSNLDGYHKLAGDRQAGDMLAESEAHRVAALDVERIMAKFESPISKAKGDALIQELTRNHAREAINGYAQAKIFQAAQKQDQELYKRRTKGYSGAWQGMNDPDGGEQVAPAQQSVQSSGARVNGSINGSPSLASGEKGFSKQMPEGLKVAIKGGLSVDDAANAALQGRIPGAGDLAFTSKVYLEREAVIAAKGGGPLAVRAEKLKIYNAAAAEIEKVPGLMGGPDGIAGRKASTTNLISTMDAIKASEEASGRDPNMYLGYMRSVVGDNVANRWEEAARLLQTRDGLSPGAARAQVRQHAIDTLRQQISMQVSSSIHDLSGGAVSDSEASRLNAFVKGSSDFGFVRSWLGHRSVELQDKEKTATVGLSGLAKLIYLNRTGVGQRAPGLPIRSTAGPK